MAEINIEKMAQNVAKKVIQELRDNEVFIGRWIPVSERLPKTDGDYLLFGKIDEDEENYIFVGEYDSCGEQFGIWEEQFDRTTLGCLGSEFYEYASVLAWMPLPEPYKGENESDECRGCHYNDGEPHAECVLCTKGRVYY